MKHLVLYILLLCSFASFSQSRLKIGKQLQKAPGINYMILTDANGEQYYTPLASIGGGNTDRSLGTVTLVGNNLIVTEKDVLTNAITATYTIPLGGYMQNMNTVDNGNGTVTLNLSGDGIPDLINICSIVASNCNATYSVSPTGIATFKDNAGNNVTFNTLSSAAGNDLTYNNGLYLSETVTATSYNPTTHALTHVNENGATNIMTLDVGALTFNSGTNTLVYTAENGVVTNVVLPSDVVTTITNTIAGHKIANYTNESGTVQPINETVTNIVGNTFLNEDGVSQDIIQTVVNTLNGNGDLVTEVNGVGSTPLVLPNSSVSNLIVGNTIATYTNSNGVAIDIDETVTAVVNNNDGTYTFTNESGTPITFPAQTNTDTRLALSILNDSLKVDVVNVLTGGIVSTSYVDNVINKVHRNNTQAVSYNGTQLPSVVGVNIGDTETVAFSDGTIVDYTWNGAVWVLNFKSEWFEQRICLNTATPSFTPANPLMPTFTEVQAWTLANLTEKQRLNGTHVVYLIPTQGGDCDNPDYTWVLNQGSELVTRIQNSILTLPNYTALRNLTKYNHDVVVVQDFIYVGPDGNSYITLGGVFKRLHNTTLIENGGTVIVGTDGSVWERDWDKVNTQPEWWEVGGYDIRGRIYSNKNIMSTLANTVFGGLQTFYDGIYDDSDRIQNAIWVADNYGLTAIKVKYQKRDYEITKVISNLLQKLPTSVFIDGEHNFNGANLVRKINPSVLLTVPIAANATTINVSDASNYKVGQSLTVYNTTAPFGGLGFDESGNYIITGIAGNTITVINVTPSKTFTVASKVMLEITMFDNRSNGGTLTYKNATITGNKLNDGVTRFIQDWRYNYNIAAGTGAIYTDFENITTLDTPGENFTTASGIVKNCRGFGLDGSFFHYSMNDIRYAQNLNTGVNIVECYVDGVSLATDAVSGHNEAAITNSLHTEYVKLTNCTFKNGSEHIIALDYGQLNTKQSYIVSDCVFENFNAIAKSILGTGQMDSREDGLQISNSKFYNSGDFIISNLFAGNSIYKGLNIDQISITDNIFVGSRFYFDECSNINFSGNQVLFRDELNSTYPDWGVLDIDVSEPPQSALFFTNSNKINIHDNIIENQFTEHPKMVAGISIPVQYTRRMKDIAGVDTDFIYEQGISVKNNKVLGFHTGINGVCRPQNNVFSLPATVTFQVVGWEFSDNLIILSGRTPTIPASASIKYVGIAGVSGTIIKNNVIYQQRADNNQCGIWGHNQAATGTGLLGTTIIGNIIYGRNTNFDITIDAFGNGFNDWNAIVTDNLTVNDIWTINPARSYGIRNARINTTTLPGFTSPKIPQFQTFEWNKSNY